MKRSIPALVVILGMLVAVGTFLSERGLPAGETSLVAPGSKIAEGRKLPSTAARWLQPEHPWTPVSQNAEPVVSRATRKLGGYKVVAAEESGTTSGGKVRRYLLKTQEKYSSIVLVQAVEARADGTGAFTALTGEVAYVADHVLVRRPHDRDPKAFEASLQATGFGRARRLGATDFYQVGLPDTGIDAVADAVVAGILGSVAEPDYLVQTSEVLDDAPVAVLDGQGKPVVNPVTMLIETGEEPSGVVPVYSVQAQQEKMRAIVGALPGGTRVLTFDPPEGWGGSFRPQVQMHNFVFNSQPSGYLGVYIQNAYTSGYPNNGGNYYRVLSAEAYINLRHKDNLPFSVHSVDLSEYSTVFAYPANFTFVGTKQTGATVTQSFRTDGIIDGTGPADDFQTFTFNSSFTDLVNLRCSNNGMYDDFVVTVIGQEIPLRPDPVLPLLYDVDWNDQQVGDTNIVGGRYAPSSINFGEVQVRASHPAMPDQPLEFCAKPASDLTTNYAQPRFDLSQGASQYVIEFECYLSDPTVLFLDGLGNQYSSLTRFDLTSGHSYYHVSVDRSSGQLVLTRNGTTVTTLGVNRTTDITDVRFSASDSQYDGGNFLDNLKIYGYGLEDDPAPTAPDIEVAPAAGITFPATSVGLTQTRLVTIANLGSQDLIISGVVSSNPQFTVSALPASTILPGGRCYMVVSYSPSGVGTHSAFLSIQSNDSEQGVLSYPVSGTALGVPQAVLTPSLLSASVVSGMIGREFFTVSNPGSAPLDWKLIDNSAGFSGAPSPLVPNDPLWPSLWGLQPSSQSGIEAAKAWGKTSGNSSVATAVIDTGVDLLHADLDDNILVNLLEIAGNGLDDDRNGYIDDVFGWDFYSDDNDPSDENRHGTHVSGIIAAEGNNGQGVAGVAWRTKILPIRFLGPNGSGYTSDAISSVDYARVRKVPLANASWGGGGYSSFLLEALNAYIEGNNALFVAAAGNNGVDNDTHAQYPSNYALDGVIAVAASDRADKLAYFSNFGKGTVDLAAPGYQILSTLPNGSYGSMSGTSMAAPHVTGALALLVSENPSMDYRNWKRILTDYADVVPGLNNLVASDARLNACSPLLRTPARWLVPELSAGTIPPGGSQLVYLAVDSTGLARGLHEAHLAFSTNDPLRGIVQLPVQITVLKDSGVNSWLNNVFGNHNLLHDSQADAWAVDANPDADAYPNLMEFALGTSPLSQDGALVRMEDGEAPGFVFQTGAGSSGVSVTAEWSATLSDDSWTSAGIEVIQIGEDPGMGIRFWKARFSGPLPSAAFFRVRAEAADPE